MLVFTFTNTGALTYFISQNWESPVHPDNDKNVRLRQILVV